MPRSFHLALLGDPVDHSRSPAIHNAALRHAGLGGEYVAIKADRRRLKEAIAELGSGALDGINVTMPLKRDALAFADSASMSSYAAGSVNALRQRGTVIEGHSTDMVAFEQILGADGFRDIPGVLVLGVGGAAAAALAVLNPTGRDTYLSSRSEAKASDLAASHNVVGVVPWGQIPVDALVVNATPVGTSGESLPEGVVDNAAALIDLPYGTRPTPAVELATGRGVPAVDGLGFLARQAAASFRWWTGVAIDFEVLEAVARNV